MRAAKPAIIEVLRGDHVESTHLVDIVVSDASGAVVSAWGEPDRAVFPRSSIKAFQALPLVESGAADDFGLDDLHLALACSSHNGEPFHVGLAREILAKAGMKEVCLECGAQVPRFSEELMEIAKNGVKPAAIHNNCSGKHAGFLAFAAHQQLDPDGYVKCDHPVQQEIVGALEVLLETPHTQDNCAIDGCAIPTYHVPLHKLAVSFARFGIGENRSKTRSEAMVRLRDACIAHPYAVAGRNRVCTQLMDALPGRVFVKVGAEGVYTAALPEKGLGLAMKARDGEPRAVEVAVSSLVADLLEAEPMTRKAMKQLTHPEIFNRNGAVVGGMRMASAA